MLPMEAIELDAFRHAHESDTFWCGTLLGGCGGRIDHGALHRQSMFPVKCSVLSFPLAVCNHQLIELLHVPTAGRAIFLGAVG